MSSLSWIRPTYYAGAVFHGPRENLREIIAEMCEAAKSQPPGKEILHTYILVFGLIFREIGAAMDTARGHSLDPPLRMISHLGQEEWDFAVVQLEELLTWAQHPVYIVQGQRRQVKTEKGEAGEGGKPRGGRNVA